MDKKRIVKDYEALPEEIVNQVKINYPNGFADHLVSYLNKEGKKVSALPFETEDIYYLIRMTIDEAEQIIADDEDYDDEGNLRDDFESDVTPEIEGEEEEEDDDNVTLRPKKGARDDDEDYEDDEGYNY